MKNSGFGTNVGIDPAQVSGARRRLAAVDRASVVRSIGNTPLVRLQRYERWLGFPDTVQLYIKSEWLNPGGSIKDRTALSIVRAALAKGDLGSGQTLLDATSGNTGIAYAMLGAALDIPVTLVVPGSASDERKRTLEAYGARVIFSDPYEGSDGAIRLVREMVSAGDAQLFHADQYNNPSNVAAHFSTTGPEIWRQAKKGVTHFVAALGTTGTLMGVGAYLKSRGDAQLVGVQPSEAFHGIEGLKHLPTAIVPGIYDPLVPDRMLGVETEEAFEAVRALARLEGFFAGSSTGANLAAVARLGQELALSGTPGRIVTIGCDTGSRYLSTGLWTGN
jgi:S-sulfo-L-cysteine synthase (O-acetyl-L-serine-dependent)